MAGYKTKNVGWCEFRKGSTVHINGINFILGAIRKASADFKQKSDVSRYTF